ncbi:hypothetical protein BD410DRAFT_810737 [Rickenella mellea]|uniref:Uncharacterized protein n=1 Tax=Rickenella mellea TaxID=50990 RepID=A0A4Y7PDA4_9AGAM|nr:hypothetical protein BD410DRAFT_810737 [Rickenella mellea]
MESMRANWRPQPERGVITLCSGNTTTATTTEERRVVGWTEYRLRVVKESYQRYLTSSPAHRITHPSTHYQSIPAVTNYFQEFLEQFSSRTTSLGIVRVVQSCCLWGVLSSGHPLIPTLSFDEDIPMHDIPHPYDISNLLSVSPDEVATFAGQNISGIDGKGDEEKSKYVSDSGTPKKASG